MSQEILNTDLRQARFGIQKIRESQYVYEYKNVWDPLKKRSKPLYRIPVGKVIDGSIVINSEYLARHAGLEQGDIVLEAGKPKFKGSYHQPLNELFSLGMVDHFVLTTGKPELMVYFYQTLGFSVHKEDERYSLENGQFKINLHTFDSKLEPKAKNINSGTADFCLRIQTKLKAQEVVEALRSKKINVEMGPVIRHGRFGEMESIYLRDPDQNLIELAIYVDKEND